MTRHLEDAELVRLALGQLDGDLEIQARVHLEGCTTCSTRHMGIAADAFARTIPTPEEQREIPTKPERPAAASLKRGSTVGRYVVLEKLGAGGMGDVYAAYDPQLDRKVAVKLLRGDGEVSDAEGQARLLREAQAMARLQHPNVIAVHDVGTHTNRVFIAMEFVDGDTITEWVRGQRGWEEVLELFTHAGQGLAAAHKAGLVHRDFKPDNVLVGTDRRPRVMDFGLAREAGPGRAPAPLAAAPEPLGAPAEPSPSDPALRRPLTRDGAILGTPGYMAPEQLTGAGADARSDQFSFCVALYEALYGQRPFAGETLRDQMAEVTAGRVKEPPPGAAAPAWVFPAIARGLTATPEARWPDMDALLKALKPPRTTNRRAMVLSLAVVAVAVVVAGYALFVRNRLMICGGQERALAGVWDGSARAALKAAFLRPRLAFGKDALASVERTMDRWALEWVGAAREACEAAKIRGVDSEALYELKRRCLEERLDQARGLLTLFGGADREVLLNAPAAAKSLDAPGRCVSPSVTPVTDVRERAQEASVRALVAQAQVLFTAGKYDEAGELLRPALVRPTPHRAAAEGWLMLGRIELKRSDLRAARAAHLHAAEHAVKAGDDRLEALSLARLYASEGYDQEEDAEALRRLAQAAASRVPGDWEVQVELALDEGLVAIRRRRFKAALVELERGLSLQREHLPPEHPDIAVSLNNLGIVLTRLGRVDDAIRRYQESLQIHRAVEGERHPNTATSAHNLAVTYRALGRLKDARRHLESALAARIESLGPSHPDSVASQLLLARVLTALGDLEPARRLVDAVVAEREKAGATPELWSALEASAELELAAGAYAQALQTAQRMVSVGSRDGSTTAAALVQAKALVGLRNVPEARRALALLEKTIDRGEPRLVAELKECLARLEVLGGRPAVAIALLEEAVALRDQSGPAQRLAADLVELARLHLAAGDRAAARAALEAIGPSLHSVDAPAELARAGVVSAALGVLDGGALDGARVRAALAELPSHERELEARWLASRGITVEQR